ncbi:unnamed protein product, partial [Ectocarpus sp. 12 AP-2014]
PSSFIEATPSTAAADTILTAALRGRRTAWLDHTTVFVSRPHRPTAAVAGASFGGIMNALTPPPCCDDRSIRDAAVTTTLEQLRHGLPRLRCVFSSIVVSHSC